MIKMADDLCTKHHIHTANEATVFLLHHFLSNAISQFERAGLMQHQKPH
jgi:hypothetical protein